MDSIVWGAEGDIYKRKNTAEHFKVISNPYLLSIEQEHRVLGPAVFCNPQVKVQGQPFNPIRFEFLAYEGIYLEKGREKVLHELFEHLLAQEDLGSALIWLDKRCLLFMDLQNYRKLGLINNFVKDSQVIIMAFYQNISDDEIQFVENLPVYAAAFDYI